MGDLGSIGGSNIEGYMMAVMALILLAQRIVSLTPGKRDDEIVNKIELWARRVMDFMAGQHTDRDDPGMIKTSKKKKE